MINIMHDYTSVGICRRLMIHIMHDDMCVGTCGHLMLHIARGDTFVLKHFVTRGLERNLSSSDVESVEQFLSNS